MRAFRAHRAALPLRAAAFAALGVALVATGTHCSFDGQEASAAYALPVATRRALLVSGLGVLGPQAALAASSVQDYRTIDQMDSSKRVIAGNRETPEAQKAIATIKGIKARVENALQRVREDLSADLSVDFAAPAPTVRYSPLDEKPNPIIKDVRAACLVVDGLMDETTRKDTERLSSLMLQAYYKILGDQAFKMPLNGQEGFMRQVALRQNPDVQTRLQGEMIEYLTASDKLLEYVA